LAVGPDDPQVLEIAVSALTDREEFVRLRAAWVFRGLGRGSSAALLALRTAAGDPSLMVEEAIAETIRQLTDEGEQNVDG
jgi:HEAT repeat protein